ncbi:MAG TPA: PQQ-dependent sugar dehydrogenase, partial [Sphingomonas sp.]
MIRHVLLSTALIATACSGQDTRNGVPRNSPLEPDIKNVPATTGRANLPIAPAPFTVTDIGRFDAPFAMAFLPGDQGLLVTEKAGALKLRQPDGKVVEIAGVPKVATGGQGGLLDVA